MPLRGAALKAETVVQRNLGLFLREMTPILIVIFGGLGMGEVLNAVLPAGARALAKESGLIAALVAGIGWVWQTNRMPSKMRWAVVVQPALLKMIYMVTAILVFKGILEDSKGQRSPVQNGQGGSCDIKPLRGVSSNLQGADRVYLLKRYLFMDFPYLSLYRDMVSVHEEDDGWAAGFHDPGKEKS